MGRVYRVDFAPGTIEIADAPAAPTAARSVATRTPEGYLRVDALISRDGLLRYSDGKRSWDEYRSRQSLLDAAKSWSLAPVTNDHPRRMVDAETWTTVAKGIHIGDSLEVTEPDADGISYLRAELLITDAQTISVIERGKTQTSIGFQARVVEATNGVTPSGARADAEQMDLVGNHTAIVARGRAGPRVRVLLDGADIAVYDCEETDVTKHKDEMGAPATETEVMGPDGKPATLPTWVAAQLAELAALKQNAPPAPPMAAPVAPPVPMAPMAPPVAPVDAAVPPAAPPAPPMAAPAAVPDPDEDKEKMISQDDIESLVAARARLVRLADRAGVDTAVCDSASFETLGRAYVAKVQPWVKTDSLSGDALAFAIDSAASMPVATAPIAHVARKRADAVDPNDPEVLFLASQGY